MAMLIKPGTPTLRMSANNSQRGITPRKFSRTIARERRYQIITTLPPANGSTSPHPAPAGPSAGSGPRPKISTGDMAICTTTLPTKTDAGKLILPVPRTALPSRLATQMQTAPPNATFAYESASASISSRPPIHWNRKGAPSRNTVEKIAATASARRKAWNTRASARSRRPAPSARATADETPTPMPLLVVCRTIITQGKASEAPARALVPMRPRKNPSNVMTPAKASKVSMFGAARRNSVGTIGPSSSSLVRAAAGLAGARPAETAGADGGTDTARLWSLMVLLPLLGREQRLRRGVLEDRVAAELPDAPR